MKLQELPRKIIDFLKEVKLEVKKVNWPTKKETLKYTITVIVVSFLVAIFLGGIDYILTFLLNKFIF